MGNRVDKQWKEKGLSSFGVEAILGTLGHYGVSYDEAGFKAAATDKYPLELALEWGKAWKGTGQFAQFPFAAVNELFARLLPEKITPQKVAVALMEVMAATAALTQNREDAKVDEAFGKIEPMSSQLPPAGERRDAFLSELVSYIEPVAKSFNELPVALAAQGKKGEAMRLAALTEKLFEDRAGTVTAVVRALTGEREAAVADLSTWAGDAARDVYARYYALDALYQLDAFDGIKAHGFAVFDAAAADKKWSLADTIAHMLATMVRKVETSADFIQQVNARLERAHAQTGGHHHH